MSPRLEEQTQTRDLERFRGFLRDGAPGSHYYAVLLGLRTYDLDGLLKIVEGGFSYAVLEHLQKNARLAPEQLGPLLGIPQRTLARRKREGRFLPEESDRILRFARLFAKALELFEGTAAASSAWLTSPQLALGGAVPIELAKTDLGLREVETLIDRLEHGVFN